MKTFIAIVAVFLTLVSAGIASALTVTPGYDSDAVNLGAVRYRSFGNTGGEEIYLGVPDLGIAANRTAKDFGSNKWGTSNSITFIYDKTADKLTTDVNTGSQIFTLEYPNFSTKVANPSLLSELNYMQIDVVGRDANTTVDFKNVYLDGNLLGNFSGTGGWFNWKVTGYDFSHGFTLTGDILLSGTFTNSQENCKVEIKFGYSDLATLITLSSFIAEPMNGSVYLFWETASEIDNVGFNLYRSESKNGGLTLLNDDIIIAEGSPTEGMAYEFIDENVQNRTTYYYMLEDIDIYGISTLHGPVSATPRMIQGMQKLRTPIKVCFRKAGSQCPAFFLQR